MRDRAFALLLLGLATCADAADDCRNTLTCPEISPDDGPCEGTCVPGPQATWQAPFLVWMGDDADAPTCPSQAPLPSADQIAPAAAAPCGACACEPSTGSCGLPSTATGEADTCAKTTPATPATPTDPPVPWDGSCTTQNAVPASAGVRSLVVGPLSVVGDGCKAKDPAVPEDVPLSPTFARTCYGTGHGRCSSNGDICMPALPLDPKHRAWTYCIIHEGAGDPYTMTCPSGYPVKRVFGSSFTDQRGCSPCTCGAPEGSSCSSLVSVYEDSSCAASLASLTVTSASSMCVDIPTGHALGSKAATPPVYTPGTCPAGGGEPTGSIDWVAPLTYCCLY